MTNWQNVGLIVSHPAHAIMVAGMVQRFSPKILIVGHSLVQQSVVHYGLSLMGLEDRASFLDVSDADSYEKAIAHDYSLHARLGEQIYEWLVQNNPDVILGDAFELSNFQHDLTRFLTDRAIHKYKSLHGRSIENYEIPICCRVEEGTGNLRFQTFPDGEYGVFLLTEQEISLKQKVADWASGQDEFISKVCKLIPDSKEEPYRAVPNDRNYAIPPQGLKKHYDDRGEEEVSAGRYTVPISFESHFVPLVQALDNTAN